MSHPIHRVAQFRIVGPYALLVAFSDGTEQRIDFAPVLHGMLFGPLRDLATLHDWLQVQDELGARARARDDVPASRSQASAANTKAG